MVVARTTFTPLTVLTSFTMMVFLPGRGQLLLLKVGALPLVRLVSLGYAKFRGSSRECMYKYLRRITVYKGLLWDENFAILNPGRLRTHDLSAL